MQSYGWNLQRLQHVQTEKCWLVNKNGIQPVKSRSNYLQNFSYGGLAQSGVTLQEKAGKTTRAQQLQGWLPVVQRRREISYVQHSTFGVRSFREPIQTKI